jgi:hypothetical protein
MKTHMAGCAASLVAVMVAGGVAAADAPAPDEIDRLVRQLGDRSFARREAASRELAVIGEPARAALTTATTDPDPEIGRRARLVLDGLAARALAAASRKELARWEGEWIGNGGQKFVVKGDRWAWGEAGPWALDKRKLNPVVIVEVWEKTVQADLLVGDPANDGRVCRAIFHLDGNTLHYCGTYDPVRPTEFRSTATSLHVAWKRVQK